MKNALFGYTYQHKVATLLLTKMDVERIFDCIEIEALVDHKFDDVKVSAGKDTYTFQIKDIDNLPFRSLKVTETGITISGKPHKLSSGINILFFKKIDFTPNTEILGFPARKVFNVYVISSSRMEIEEKMNELYKTDYRRKFIIDKFLYDRLDKRNLLINRQDLPAISVFNTQLLEPTVILAREILKVENILVLEGKPGIGKSHLVAHLEKQYKKHVIYRFWVSNMDKDYEHRLKFNNFLADLSKKIFGDSREYTQEQIIDRIKDESRTVIIDGLDHVENYNIGELEQYIIFIERLGQNCKTIVLSRPLLKTLPWTKQVLCNWNKEETKKILKDLYHIQKYDLVKKIYQITDGYPILVRHIAEQYKLDRRLPDFGKLDSIDQYYDELMKNEKGKEALALFLCTRGFIMKSEIDLFHDEMSAGFVQEFITEHPYLFEIRLNRVSLFHDSMTTYLRKSQINYSSILHKVNATVYQSLISGNKRFQSRFSHFDLPVAHKKEIIKWYSSIGNFQKLIHSVIDFEALQTFYTQLREALQELNPEDLELIEYYDLQLIINLVERDHLSTLNEFYYTYLSVILSQGYSYEDITSSRYLFGMLYYMETGDGSVLLKTTSNDDYETRNFYQELAKSVKQERCFFEKHKAPLSTERINELLDNDKDVHFKHTITDILENLFLYKDERANEFKELFAAVNIYMTESESYGIDILLHFFHKRGISDYYANWVLTDVKKNLLALGLITENNDYLDLSLKDYLSKHKDTGSFDMWVGILNYLRLALHLKREVDIPSISVYWTKYHQRKDYSFSTLDVILSLFEEKGFIDWQQSVELITQIQEVSEKGYRDLLAEYILKHPAAFILELLEKYHHDDLNISWFGLPAEYINILPLKIYNYAISALIKQNSYGREIKFEEIVNVFHSEKIGLLLKDLKSYGYKISVPYGHPIQKELREKKFLYVELPQEKEYKLSSPEETFDQGIINEKNKHLIAQKQLKPYEIAQFGDGFYSALGKPELFDTYSKLEIRDNIQAILYHALLSKTKSIQSFHYLGLLPGHILSILSKNDIPADYGTYFKSFSAYLNLSMFELTKISD